MAQSTRIHLNSIDLKFSMDTPLFELNACEYVQFRIDFCGVSVSDEGLDFFFRLFIVGIYRFFSQIQADNWKWYVCLPFQSAFLETQLISSFEASKKPKVIRLIALMLKFHTVQKKTETESQTEREVHTKNQTNPALSK